MRLRASLFLFAAVAGCLRPESPSPTFVEEAVLATGDDGTLLVAEVRIDSTPVGELFLLAPGRPRQSLERLDPALAERIVAEGARRGPTSLREAVVARPGFEDLLRFQALVLATPLAPTPGARRHAYELEGLTLALGLDVAGLAGAKLAVVTASDGGATERLASTTLLDERWVVDAYRAGPRVAFVVGSREAGEPVRRIQAVLTVDLRRAQARFLDRRGLAKYRQGALEEAAALFRKAAVADPSDPDPPYDEACVLSLLGDLKGASERLELALALDPLRLRDHAARDPDLGDLWRVSAMRERFGLPAR